MATESPVDVSFGKSGKSSAAPGVSKASKKSEASSKASKSVKSAKAEPQEIVTLDEVEDEESANLDEVEEPEVIIEANEVEVPEEDEAEEEGLFDALAKLLGGWW